MKCIWEIVRPGSEPKLFQFMLFCLSLEKKFRDQLKWLSLDKGGLIRATEPVFACIGIYPKEIKRFGYKYVYHRVVYNSEKNANNLYVQLQEIDFLKLQCVHTEK